MMVVTLMPIVQVTRARTHDGSDSRAFASACERANCRASRRTDSNALEGPHVAAVPVMRLRIVPRGAHGYVGCKHSKKHKESKNNGYQTVFHIDPTPY
jgi:hypothetical protein